MPPPKSLKLEDVLAHINMNRATFIYQEKEKSVYHPLKLRTLTHTRSLKNFKVMVEFSPTDSEHIPYDNLKIFMTA